MGLVVLKINSNHYKETPYPITAYPEQKKEQALGVWGEG